MAHRPAPRFHFRLGASTLLAFLAVFAYPLVVLPLIASGLSQAIGRSWALFAILPMGTAVAGMLIAPIYWLRYRGVQYLLETAICAGVCLGLVLPRLL